MENVIDFVIFNRIILPLTFKVMKRKIMIELIADV
jgi:hypothetical protein